MKAKCAHCHEVIEVTHPHEFKACKCGAIALDYGDGYYPTHYATRFIGDPADFDKEFDEENGIERFKEFKLEQPEEYTFPDDKFEKLVKESVMVKTVCGENIISLDELSELIFKWFEEKDLHDVPMQFVKMSEECGELAHQITRNAGLTVRTIDALGDILVAVFGLCHHLRVPPAAALSYAWNQIKDRTGKTVNGSFIKD